MRTLSSLYFFTALLTINCANDFGDCLKANGTWCFDGDHTCVNTSSGVCMSDSARLLVRNRATDDDNIGRILLTAIIFSTCIRSALGYCSSTMGCCADCVNDCIGNAVVYISFNVTMETVANIVKCGQEGKAWCRGDSCKAARKDCEKGALVKRRGVSQSNLSGEASVRMVSDLYYCLRINMGYCESTGGCVTDCEVGCIGSCFMYTLYDHRDLDSATLLPWEPKSAVVYHDAHLPTIRPIIHEIKGHISKTSRTKTYSHTDDRLHPVDHFLPKTGTTIDSQGDKDVYERTGAKNGSSDRMLTKWCFVALFGLVIVFGLTSIGTGYCVVKSRLRKHRHVVVKTDAGDL